MPVGFIWGALSAIAFVLVVAVMLYARAMATAFDEPYFKTLWALIAALGRFR